MSEIPITAADFAYIRKLVRDRTALDLADDKTYLVESRLTPLARQLGLDNLGDLVRHLRTTVSPDLHQQVAEAMVTTETLFFRDQHPFTALQHQVLPKLIQARQTERCLNIWCAACSSGQEPYSLSILLQEHFPQLQTWTINLLASDISGDILTRAQTAHYSQHEVDRGMSPALRRKYFHRTQATTGKIWALNPEILEMVEFQQFSLAQPWPYLPPMDLILLRNVLIYFDTPTKQSILAKVRQQLRPDGYLLLGAGETTLTIDQAFEPLQMARAVFYQLRL